MWANDVDTPTYAERARRRSAAGAPAARTIRRGARPVTAPVAEVGPRPRSSASRPRATRRRPRSSRRGTVGAVVGREQPGRPPRPLRRRRARDRQPGPRRADRAGRRPGVRRGRAVDRPSTARREIDAVAATDGPGLVGALLVGVSRRQGARPRVGRAVRRRQPPRGATSTPPSSRSPTSSCRSSCCSCRAATRCSSTWRTTAATGCSARRSTTPPARPSTRWPASSASATRAARPSTARRCRATPRPSRSPGPMAGDGTYDFSFSGLKTAVVNHVRKHPDVSTADVAAIVPGGGGRRARHQGPGGGPRGRAPRACASAAGWRPTPACGSGSSTPARRTASAASSPAGPCAPTTPP